MKIVVLDGFTANPGDLSWDELTRLGHCEIHDRTPTAEVVQRARDADVLLTNKTVVAADSIARLPALRYIGVVATGYNNVDTAAARARLIPVCNVPEYGTSSVAQATFALLLELTNQVGHHAQTVRDGRWCESKDFCYWDGTLIELAGLTLGIVGHGRIGQAVARVGRAFGMRVLVARRAGSQGPAGPEDIELDGLFHSSDVVSLHCPLTSETRALVNARTLDRMKPSALLLNTARGGLIHEPDLAEALNAERIAGAGLDVLSVEPPTDANPLLRARNCIVTPHIAWATRAARARLIGIAASNVRAFLDGKPQNVVNL